MNTMSTTVTNTCIVCGESFAAYRPQQRCCGPSCRKQHKSTYGTERQRARRASLVPADATNGRKRQCDAVTPYSARPARSYRFGETAAILPSEQQPSRTTKMTDAEFEQELARSKREILDRGGALIDRGWRERMANRKGGGE